MHATNIDTPSDSNTDSSLEEYISAQDFPNPIKESLCGAKIKDIVCGLSNTHATPDYFARSETTTVDKINQLLPTKENADMHIHLHQQETVPVDDSGLDLDDYLIID